jgi:glycosyltransferase involved in cell wall biosynthesis
LNATYGTRADPARITLLPAPRLPGIHSGTTLAYWQRARFERFCRPLGRDFDACLSAYNPIRFGAPAIQLIGDFSFDEACRLRLYPHASEQARHRPSPIRRGYLAAGEWIAGRRGRPALAPGDRVVANSAWSAGILRRIFDLPDAPVLHPPVLPARGEDSAARDPLGFVCLGRVVPDKELDTVIDILDRVRAAGRPVTLDLVGSFGDTAHARRIRRLVDARRDWIRTPGFLGPRDKSALFARRSFAIHGCRVEAFGIAVAEMAAAGLVPFVPAEGGSNEIVAEDGLIYRGTDDAVGKILARLADPSGTEALRPRMREHAARFAPEHFARKLVGIVHDFLKHPPTPT